MIARGTRSGRTSRDAAAARPAVSNSLTPGGRPRKINLRNVVDAFFYVLRTGCRWRYLPKHSPPRPTVWRYFDEWLHYGTPEAIRNKLRERVNKEEGKKRRLRPAASMASRCRPRRAASSVGPTRTKRSRAASGISSWIRWAHCWPWR